MKKDYWQKRKALLLEATTPQGKARTRTDYDGTPRIYVTNLKGRDLTCIQEPHSQAIVVSKDVDPQTGKGCFRYPRRITKK